MEDAADLLSCVNQCLSRKASVRNKYADSIMDDRLNRLTDRGYDKILN